MTAVDVPFAKGHGTENDFVLLFDPERSVDLTPRLVSAICDRRSGLGADGLLRVVLAATDPEGAQMSDEARWFMDYRNADGSLAEMCGNGVRVFARFLVDRYLERPGEVQIATRAGVIRVDIGVVGDAAAHLGPYELPDVGPVSVTTNGHQWPAVAVNTPNPHVVAFVDDLADAGDLVAAPAVSPAFAEGVNVEFAVSRGPGEVAMRVHERGVGETRSCGTGACAVAVAASLRHPATRRYVVHVPGGELGVELEADQTIVLTGPAVLVAEGVLHPDWLAAHR